MRSLSLSGRLDIVTGAHLARSRKSKIDIHYEVKGEGPPLVMLRGLARNSLHWLGFDQKAAEHFRVVTIDARGLGKTARAMGALDSIYDLAEDVVRVLDTEKMESAHILGVSLGGMVSMATGLRYPGRASSLIVINSSYAGSSHPRLSREAIMVLLRAIVAGPDVYSDLARLLLGPDANDEVRQRVASDWLAIDRSLQASPAVVVKQLIAAFRFRVADDLAQIKKPTLVLFGEGDQFVPNINSRAIAGLIPGAELVGIPGGGHELTLDCPVEVLNELIRFTSQVDESRSDSAPGRGPNQSKSQSKLKFRPEAKK